MWPQLLTSLLKEVSMKEKRKVLDGWSTVSATNCSAIAWPNFYSDYNILIKRQTRQGPFSSNGNRRLASAGDISLSGKYFKETRLTTLEIENFSLPLFHLPSGYWLSYITLKRHCTPYCTPYLEEPESDVVIAKSCSGFGKSRYGNACPVQAEAPAEPGSEGLCMQ